MGLSRKIQIGAGLMVLGSIAMAAPLFGVDVPLFVLSLSVLVLTAGTVLVGTSGIGPGEYPV